MRWFRVRPRRPSPQGEIMSIRKLVVLAGGLVLAGTVLTGPAWAHVQVEAQPGSPGAPDATLKITAAGESATAGVAKLDITADPAIPADQVTLVSGPAGWTVGPGGQGGFSVGGPAVPKGQDASVSVKVKQLPDAPQVVFKVLQTYSDGQIDRWIELPGPDGQEPDKPAPIVKLTAGAQSAVSPKPSNDEDTDAKAAGAPLAGTGAGDRALAAAGGGLLALGGSSVLVAAGRRRSFARR
jgi:uncharacterized protein YcnI